MTKTAVFLGAALVFLALQSSAVLAQNVVVLPTLKDAISNAWLQDLYPEYKKWASNPPAYFPEGAAASPLSCQLSPADLELLAGVPNLEATRAEYAKHERKSGLKPGALPVPSISNVQVLLLKGACAEGKWSGPVEILTRYQEASSNAASSSTYPWVRLIRFDVVNGQPTGRIFRAFVRRVPTGDVTQFGFTDLQKTRRAEINYYSNQQWESVAEPAGPNRSRVLSFAGQQPRSDLYFLDGVPHGKATYFAHTFGNPPVSSPARTICYDRGEEIKGDLECKVD